jgi:hypothetical protein
MPRQYIYIHIMYLYKIIYIHTYYVGHTTEEHILKFQSDNGFGRIGSLALFSHFVAKAQSLVETLPPDQRVRYSAKCLTGYHRARGMLSWGPGGWPDGKDRTESYL